MSMVLFLAILWNLIIPLTLSYFIFKLIYRKVFKSQKKVSKFLVFIGGIAILSSFHVFNISYYFQPSYYEFKKMCALNELPNNEEKYNKILGYYGLSLDTLDWEKIGKEKALEKKTAQFFYDALNNEELYDTLSPIYTYWYGYGYMLFKHKPTRENIIDVRKMLHFQSYLLKGNIGWNISTDGSFYIPAKTEYCVIGKY